MLDFTEADQVRELFGSTDIQVRRDHAISHILAALQDFKSEMVFFGGTALSRTFLMEGRLSEDIDLYSSQRVNLVSELEAILELLREEFPLARWSVSPSVVNDPQSALLECEAGIQIKIQVLDSFDREWEKVPTEMRAIHQRYSDAKSARLLVPTLDGFIAMKVLAWFDRGVPRDLFDLNALSQLSEVTLEARELITRLRGYSITRTMLNRKISGLWREELSHQTKLEVTEEECLQRVLEWWAD